MPNKTTSVVIVGAGVFGLTLALELSERGYQDITVLDRYIPPVPDGSSVDISRVVRSEYADPFYMNMAKEAIEGWKAAEFSHCYHESGLLICSESTKHPYLEAAKSLTRESGAAITQFDSSDEVRQNYPHYVGLPQELEGYLNSKAGWAASEVAIRTLAMRCTKQGVSFMIGSRGTVTSLIIEEKKVRGVNVLQGPPILADTLVLATGAWTSQVIDMTTNALSTAHPVGYIQLTEDEAMKYASMPITLNLTSGFFVFPAIPQTRILKFACHGHGYETQISTSLTNDAISSPNIFGNGALSSFMPADAEKMLRQGLAQFFPAEIAERQFSMSRMCWYTETPDGDFIVDYHRDLEGLFLATGGSGHAFKFLPVLGKYTADLFERKGGNTLRQKWAHKVRDEDQMIVGDGSLGGPPRRKLESWEQEKMFSQ